MLMPCTMTSHLLVDAMSDALLCSASGKGAGVVAPHNPHPTTSLLRCLLASNRSNDLCGPYGTTRLSLDRSAAPFFSSNRSSNLCGPSGTTTLTFLCYHRYSFPL
ncbi:hypothetical protein B296_00003278 [Ensete ventricosum]|uniref:Uncharacterized protein n=1 Tax=Ensete ventricosum TaxID=4639 RepID=A0A426YEV2_ENSVE|nr:hypothetical protein B296_00003278 [Ensete ventricosum]